MRISVLKCLVLPLVLVFISFKTNGQQSVARQWNELLLESIRNDFARPTVHARNLFHISAAMYDAWAAYDSTALTYLLGNNLYGFNCPFDDVILSSNPEDRNKTISYAAYRLLTHRFQNSPGVDASQASYDSLMNVLGYDISFTSTDYSNGDVAALGNYIAQNYISYGHQDNSNEESGYSNLNYSPLNEALVVSLPGNPNLVYPNHWQPLTLEIFIDQSGNVISGKTPDFLSPEWGLVWPFALTENDLTIYTRDNFEYWVYHDPGDPPYIDLDGVGTFEDQYKWNFVLVAIWSSHLAPSDSVMWDISPASIGNNPALPASITEYDQFYNLFDGGDQSRGHTVNPKTGLAYTPQVVFRADYARVLAEFWADGPDSETPPGHWFTILNYVSDHPLVVKKFKGQGSVIDNLEWDIKAYFALGGAVHDAAVSAWGIKGWYDYIRPVSAIRSMADRGQSSDSTAISYDEDGIPLYPGFIELVLEGDLLAGNNNENVGKIKLKAWKGPDYITDPKVDEAGVDWILAENWWPYQRPSFVTPPFAGYISGHSTFSRAAAEVMTLLTGDEYFPGGMGEFLAPKNEFLVFEEGPSMDITLQWATYRDASDQTSLSRIWGGIHPPADDIPGRLIGREIGIKSFELAEKYFNGTAQVITSTEVDPKRSEVANVKVYPNPLIGYKKLRIVLNELSQRIDLELIDILGRVVISKQRLQNDYNREIELDLDRIQNGVYLLNISGKDWSSSLRVVVNN